MFCPKCGKENSDENRFCENCGFPLPTFEKTAEEQSPVTPETEDSVEENTASETESPAKETAAPETENPVDENAASETENPVDENAASEMGESQEEPSEEAAAGGSEAASWQINDILKLILTVSGVVIAILYLVSALRSVPGILLEIALTLTGSVKFGIGIFSVLSSIISILSCVLMAVGLLLFAIARDDERNNTESLLLVVASGGILQIVLNLVSYLLIAFAYLFVYGRFYFSAASFGKTVLFALLAVAIEVGLTFLAGYRPFIGKSTEDVMNMIKNLPDVLTEEIDILGKKYKNKTGKKQTNTTGGTYSDDTAAHVIEPMNEKRSLLKYILVGALTCGIYMLYMIYTFARDVNVMCKEDGETTPGLIKLILLSLVTCGIYSWVWYYKMLSRIERQEKKWGIQVQTALNMDLGAAYIVLKLVGVLITVCGIGLVIYCYADYLVLHNLNELSREYNSRIAGSTGEAD